MSLKNTKFYSFLAILLGIILIMLSITGFWIGYHNIDLAWNFKSTNSIDRGSDGILRNPTEMYMLGLDQIFNSFYFGILGGFFFGIAIIKMFEEVRDEMNSRGRCNLCGGQLMLKDGFSKKYICKGCGQEFYFKEDFYG